MVKKRSHFLQLTKAELMAALRAGHPVDPRGLDDTDYKGTSLGLPGFVERLTWKKFRKTFHRDPKTGVLRGWNVRLEQNEYDEPSIPRMKNGEAMTFGHYHVVSPVGHRVPKGCDQGLLIHYGLGQNPPFDPTARARDPLVAVNADDFSLLLGWSYVELFGMCVGTPSFFTLEYEGPLSFVVPPPRA